MWHFCIAAQRFETWPTHIPLYGPCTTYISRIKENPAVNSCHHSLSGWSSEEIEVCGVNARWMRSSFRRNIWWSMSKTSDYQWHVATWHNIMSGNMQGRQKLLTNTTWFWSAINHTDWTVRSMYIYSYVTGACFPLKFYISSFNILPNMPRKAMKVTIF